MQSLFKKIQKGKFSLFIINKKIKNIYSKAHIQRFLKFIHKISNL